MSDDPSYLYDPSELRQMEIEAELKKARIDIDAEVAKVRAKWRGLAWIAFWTMWAILGIFGYGGSR